MNRNLANYIFTGEILFAIKSESEPKNKVAKNTESEVDVHQEIIDNKDKIIPNDTVFVTQKSIIVFVDNITDHEKELLGKILLAAKLNYQHIDFINMVDEKRQIDIAKSTKTILFFGTNPKKFEFQFKPVLYQIQNFNNINFVIADKIAVLFANEKDEKRKLWAVMKSLFNV